MSARAQLGAARRVVVKVGSSSLTTLTGGLDPARLDALVDALATRRADGQPGGARLVGRDRGRARAAGAGPPPA